MLIDWFTVAAQTINFLILVWLLKRFLYRPIQDAIDERERQTAKIVADAANLKAEADQQLQTYVQHNQQFAEQRDSLLNDATEQANRERDKLIEDAKRAAEQLRSNRLQGLQQELVGIQQHIVSQNLREVYATSSQVLTDLAGEDLQQKMFERFLQRLQSAFSKETLIDHTQHQAVELKPGDVVVVHSGFALNDKQRQQIEQCLHQQLPSHQANTYNPNHTQSTGQQTASLRLDFQVDAELICGVEISVNGWKLAWSSNNYLQRLQQKVARLSAESTSWTAKSNPIVPSKLAPKPDDSGERH